MPSTLRNPISISLLDHSDSKHPRTSSKAAEQSSPEDTTIMFAIYAEGLEIVAEIREQIDDMRSDGTRRRITVQKMYVLGQSWNRLRTALTAAGETTDRAVVASEQQRAASEAWERRLRHCSQLHRKEARACRQQFRYAMALAQHARTVQRRHDAELLAWTNLHHHHSSALGPQTDQVPSHPVFLSALGTEIESINLHQQLQTVYIRYMQSRAAAKLRNHSVRFQLLRRRLWVAQARAGLAARRSIYRDRKTARVSEEYEVLEEEVVDVRRAIRMLGVRVEV